MIPDYPIEFWFLGVPAVVLYSISKAGFGVGVGFLVTPLLTLTIPATEAVTILAPLLIITDFFTVIHYRLTFHRQSIALLLPAAMIGIAAGALFFGYFRSSQRSLQMVMGILALSFVLFQLLRAAIMGAVEARRPPRAAGLLLGALSGFISTLSHAGGPPIAIYLLPQKLPRQLFVGTTVIFFTVVNLVKIIPYQMLGLFNPGNLSAVLWLAPLTYIGVQLGLYFNRRFTDLWFNRVIYALLFVIGIQLVVGKNLLAMLLGK
ncbi:MAG: sulfite exporter TauE/SafE family protein [Thermodesulfobacteriota bacterium]